MQCPLCLCGADCPVMNIVDRCLNFDWLLFLFEIFDLFLVFHKFFKFCLSIDLTG